MKNGNGCKRGGTHLYFNAKNIVSTTLEKTHILSVLIPLRYLKNGAKMMPVIQDWKDAAEFEARVAAYIAFWSQIMSCPTRAGCKAQSILECDACWLKHARIVVEKEME